MWSKVQDKLQNGAVSARGSAKVPDESLLRKILIDADGRSYRATFTNKNGKRYRYYACEKLDGAVSKIPAHEIETMVENSIRDRLGNIKKIAEIFHLDEEYDNYLLNKIIECSPCISTSDLLGTAVKKVMLTEMKVIISLDMAGLRKLIMPKQISRTESLNLPANLACLTTKHVHQRVLLLSSPKAARKVCLTCRRRS